MTHKLKVKSLFSDLEKINYSREGDAGLDLRASNVWIVDLDTDKKEIVSDEYEIKPNERILVKTGIKVAIPPGHYGNIKARSGLAMKHGLQPLAGVIEENYREEIGVVLVNLSTKPYKIMKNERIAQMIIQPYSKVNVEHVNDLDLTNRDDGFGSSGKY